MNKHTALIVEDDIEIAHLLSLTLTRMNVEATIVYTGNDAKSILEQHTYDLVLLDLMLPGISGDLLLGDIKTNSNSKVIVISAKSDVTNKVELLEKGADDYITKPFDAKELAARINVQLRNVTNVAHGEILEWKGLSLDTVQRKVLFNHQEINLTNSEYDILNILIKSPERPISKRTLYEKTQGMYLGDDNTINVHVSNLRKKIAQHTNESYIKTVWGIGFMLI